MSDTKEIVKCPACGKDMEKVYIEDSFCNIDICANGCGGIYFDNRELEKFDEKHENADKILSHLEGKEFYPTNSAQIRICPVCGANMTKVGAAGGNIEIDVCYTCGGKFLDLGELRKIRNHINNNAEFDQAIDDIFDSMHRDYVKPTTPSKRRLFFENLAKKMF